MNNNQGANYEFYELILIISALVYFLIYLRLSLCCVNWIYKSSEKLIVPYTLKDNTWYFYNQTHKSLLKRCNRLLIISILEKKKHNIILWNSQNKLSLSCSGNHFLTFTKKGQLPWALIDFHLRSAIPRISSNPLNDKICRLGSLYFTMANRGSSI